MFHRLTVPTYYGGLPVGADYLNTPSLSGGSGVPAYMDGQKSSGPNDGTYFFAFGEDATSSFFNRGLKALGENTDTLDDLMRRDLSMPGRTNDVTAGAPVASVTLTGQIFVGTVGTTNSQANRDLLVSVLDADDNEIIDENGVKVVASWIHNGSNSNVVGVPASGFYDGPSVTLSPPIPAGTVYRVYYGVRGNLASMPVDAFTTMRIRAAEEVSAEVERMFKSLHTSTPSVAWDTPWVATINALARGGLDARYRLSTYDNYSSPALDTAGNGANITRDGVAVTFTLPEYATNIVGSIAMPYPDPYMACLRLVPPDVWGSAFNVNRGGDSGLMQLSGYFSTGDANERSLVGVSGPLLMEVIPRDVRASGILGNTVSTRINATAIATLNPDAGTTAVDRSTIQLGDFDYFRSPLAQSIRRHLDLLEVTVVSTGEVLGVFRINQHPANNRVELRALSGAYPSIGLSGGSTPVRVRWLQTTMSLGGRLAAANGDSYVPHFFVAQPSAIQEGWDQNVFRINAAFLSAYGSFHRDDGATNASFNAFVATAWGAFDSSGSMALTGYLLGDGGILCTSGRQQFNLVNRRREPYATGSGGRTCTWTIGTSGGFVEIYTSGAPWTTATTIVFDYQEVGYTAQAGDEFELLLHIPPGSTGPVQLTWGMPTVFSGMDATVPDTNLTAGTLTIKYQFVYSSFVNAWVATRTDY